jgi:mRNA interferase RelE/StbE
MRIGFSPGAWRDWKRLPSAVRIRLQEKLARYAQDPLKHAVKLTDPQIGRYRFRVGDYRVVFDIEHDALVVLAVGHRKDIYR